MKEKDARLVTLEREINLVQDEFMKTCNEYEKTVKSKEIRIKSIQDAVTKIESVLDERVDEMKGENISLEIIYDRGLNVNVGIRRMDTFALSVQVGSSC